MTQKTHTLTALVENKAGVLNRIASLFRRRRFNIESLTVGHSERLGLSRMTIVVDAETTNVDQVVRQMYKVVEVIKVKELPETESVIRDLALIKVGVTKNTKSKLVKTLKLFHARIVDENSKNLTVEIVGEPDKINSFFELVKPFGVKEISRTGATAMRKGA